MNTEQDRKNVAMRKVLSITRHKFKPRNKKALKKHLRNQRAIARRQTKRTFVQCEIQFPSHKRSRQLYGRMYRKYGISEDVTRRT